jgi:hypothetical protein
MTNAANGASLRHHMSEIRHLDAARAKELVGPLRRPATADTGRPGVGMDARHLARHAGQLHLRGGRRLGDATAEALGTRRGFLCLRGVERLSPLQAWLLAGHEGPLFLDDMDIDTAVAEQLGQEALVQHVGPLTIAGLEELDAPTARIPAAQAGLPFGNLFTLAAEASGLASARGGFAHSPRRFAS